MLDQNENAYLDEDEGIIELEDQDGNVTRFEFVDRAELDGVVYFALIPADFDEEEGASEFVVLKEIIDENGESMLSTVDDDAEYEKAGEMFLKRFAELPELDIQDDSE